MKRHDINPRHATTWKGQAVGLLGGSFNPAHDGHLHVSLQALKLLGLDAVWWMVSPQNPLKSTTDMAPLAARLESAKEVATHPDIHVTDIENQLHTRYTVDTIIQLQKNFPHTQFVWLMGTDNLLQFHQWREWERLFSLLPIAVFDRPPVQNTVKSCVAHEKFRAALLPQEEAHILKDQKTPAWTILHIPLNSQSATKIRETRKLQSN